MNEHQKSVMLKQLRTAKKNLENSHKETVLFFSKILDMNDERKKAVVFSNEIHSSIRSVTKLINNLENYENISPKPKEYENFGF